uniref:7TM_GPCR_Srx domain-containing protein n=1 Tax=Globodera pallida TaxID=36090 RepID=A0A183CGT0_GLOPA
MILCVLINIATFVAYKQHLKKVRKNGSNNGDEIEKKLLIYALATFLGHFLFASLYLVGIVLNSIDPPTMPVIFIYHPLIMDTGSVV